MSSSNSLPSREDRHLYLLESMVSNQKQMIDLLSSLNSNLEEIMLDIRDMKNNTCSNNTNYNPNATNNNASSCFDEQQPTSTLSNLSYSNSNTSLSQQFTNQPDEENDDNELNDNELTENNEDNVNNEEEEASQLNTTTSNNNEYAHHNSSSSSAVVVVDTNRLSVSSLNNIENNFKNLSNEFSNQIRNQLSSNLQQVSSLFNLSNMQNRITRENTKNEADQKQYKQVKNGLREFSTYVSRAVRQEFGPNYLALNRINELDRFVMQRIKDEAISKYLPNGVSPQLAWNHAMNSLRQLRHRACKKAKGAD